MNYNINTAYEHTKQISIRKDDMRLLDYIEHLNTCINESQKVAERESSLYPNVSVELENIKIWYSHIYEWIKNHPPKYYVKYLEVAENFDSKITSIRYIYYEKNSLISEASIKVISELYDI